MMNFLLIDVMRGSKNVNLPPESIDFLLKTAEFLGKEFYEEAFEWITDLLVLAGISTAELSMVVVDNLPALLDWMMENKLITGGGLLVAMWLRRRVGVVGPLWARWRPTHMPKSLKVWKKGSWKVDHPGLLSLAHMSRAQIADHYGVDEKTAGIIETRVDSAHKQLYSERGKFRRIVLSRKLHLDLFSDIDLICITGARKGKSGGLARAEPSVIGGQYGIDVTTAEGLKLAEEIHRESLAFDTEYRGTGALGKTANYLRSRTAFLSTAADRARVLRKSFAKRVTAYHSAKGIVHSSEVDTEDNFEETTEIDQAIDTNVESAKPAVAPQVVPTVDPAAEQKLRTELRAEMRAELATELAALRLAQETTGRLQQELDAKTKALEASSTANAGEVAKLRAEVADANAQANESIAQTEAKSQTGVNDSFQGSVVEMQNKLDGLRKEVKALRESSKLELDKATKALSDKVAALESSQAEATQAQETLARKTQELAQAQETSVGDTKKLTDEVAKARADVAKLQQDVIAKVKEEQQARALVEVRLQAQVDVLAEVADSARAEAEAQAETVVELQNQLEAAKLEQETQGTTTAENTDTRVKAEQALQARIDGLTEQLKQARTATTTQGEAVTQLQQDLAKANEQLAAQKKAAGESALELDKRLSKMQSENEAAVRLLQRESDAAKEKQNQLTEALKAERDSNGQNITRIDGELQAATERAAALEQELALAKQQQTELATQVAEVKKSQQEAQNAQQRGPRDLAPAKTDPRSDGKGPDKGSSGNDARTDPKGPRESGKASDMEFDPSGARPARSSTKPSSRPDLGKLASEACRNGIDVRGGTSDVQIKAGVDAAKANARRR